MRRRWLWTLFPLAVLGAGLGLLWQWQTRYIYPSPESAPRAPVAIVFGAAVYPGNRLSTVLADRVTTAVMLYQQGTVDHVLLSGDNRFVTYNEPGAMLRYAQALGVPPDALQPDYAGRRTYDTCYRARAIFGVRRALLVTQQFHLPRAIFICRALGIEAYGVVADRRVYSPSARLAWTLREIAAWVRALLDVWVLRPVPVLGPPIPLGTDTP